MKLQVILLIGFLIFLTMVACAQSNKIKLEKELNDYLSNTLIALSSEWDYKDAKRLLYLLDGDRPHAEKWRGMVEPFKGLGKIVEVKVVTKEIRMGGGKSAAINTMAKVKVLLVFENRQEAIAECILFTRGSPWKLESIQKIDSR